MSLSHLQLLQLSTLIYAIHRTDYKRQNFTVEYLVGKIRNEIGNGGLPKNPALTTASEWRQFLDLVAKDKRLMAYHIRRLKFHNGFLAFTAIDRHILPRDVNIIIRGTATLADWDDNAVSAYSTSTPLQRFAYRYLCLLPLRYGRNITAAGHSKGGNHAAYLAVRSNRIKRAVGFDAPGFSPEFIAHYTAKIKERAHKITNTSSAGDSVHAFLIQLPGVKQIFLKTPRQANPLKYHKPTALIDLDTGVFYPRTPKHHLSAKAIAGFASLTSTNIPLEQRRKIAHAIVEAAKKQIMKQK